MIFPSPGGSGLASAMSLINETLANKELNFQAVCTGFVQCHTPG